MDNVLSEEEKLKSQEPQHGGAREGAGRKKGGVNEEVAERRAVMQRWRNRTMQNIDNLFNAQINLAQGITFLYRIDETTGENGKTKRVHVLVTDPEEIKEALDSELKNGEDYYYITTKTPDNYAIDSMLDRTFGKASQSLDVTTGGEKIDKINVHYIDELRSTSIESPQGDAQASG